MLHKKDEQQQPQRRRNFNYSDEYNNTAKGDPQHLWMEQLRERERRQL